MTKPKKVVMHYWPKTTTHPMCNAKITSEGFDYTDKIEEVDCSKCLAWIEVVKNGSDS